MAIKSIRVSNFKSFDNFYVELSDFNILIGANASGKSNFLQIIRFFKDIGNYGLDNAISLQGGIEYLRNINIGAAKNLDFEIVLDSKYRRNIELDNEQIVLQVEETIYKFVLKFYKQNLKVKIVEDTIKQKCVFFRRENQKNQKYQPDNIISEGELIVSSTNKKPYNVNYKSYKGEALKIANTDIFPFPAFLKQESAKKPHLLLLETPLFSFLMPSLVGFFSGISIYDFDPKLPKKAISITGKAELEQDGSNLAIVIKKIIQDSDNKRKLTNILSNILGFINDFNIESFADKSLLIKLQEKYSKADNYIPASLISDGTVNIIALIVVLYFEDKELIVIEEPERNIHPYLISKVVEMMKESSHKKQIITTTHNPEMVKYADLENLIFISRDEQGFSKISRPSEQEEVKVFLENHIGIEELYVQNLLNG